MMDGKTQKDCEAECLAAPRCTSFSWVPSYPGCMSLECPPGVNTFRPDPKIPADMRTYKCKDGEFEPCANNDLEVARQIAELCKTRGIKGKKCPGTCSSVVASPCFQNDPLCDRVNPVAWFPDACPF